MHQSTTQLAYYETLFQLFEAFIFFNSNKWIWVSSKTNKTDQFVRNTSVISCAFVYNYLYITMSVCSSFIISRGTIASYGRFINRELYSRESIRRRSKKTNTTFMTVKQKGQRHRGNKAMEVTAHLKLNVQMSRMRWSLKANVCFDIFSNFVISKLIIVGFGRWGISQRRNRRHRWRDRKCG